MEIILLSIANYEATTLYVPHLNFLTLDKKKSRNLYPEMMRRKFLYLMLHTSLFLCFTKESHYFGGSQTSQQKLNRIINFQNWYFKFIKILSKIKYFNIDFDALPCFLNITP